MKIVLLVLQLTLYCSNTLPEICHACFNGMCFFKRKIFEGKQFSGQIAVDRMDNLLHLHYKDYRSNDYTAVLDLYSDCPKPFILPVDYSSARAVNDETGDVYFSGARGMYVYNSITKETKKLGLFNTTICHMQFKGKLFYTECRTEGIYYKNNNRTGSIRALSDYVIDDFVVDKFDDIYFISDYILHRYKKDDDNARVFSNMLYSLTTDKFNNVYLIETTSRTLFKIDYIRDRIKEVGIFRSGSVFRAVFDRSNNLIYCDVKDDRVYHLFPSYTNCTIVRRKKTRDLIDINEMTL
ncbi:unnamed protein product [Chilo suppressalis]|uniref:Ommochrome-binding protein-like n=1 Tax=Chilo suppressalis TaxID=168631 RepID=A0ABN8L9J2_CHISP|nr:unnamed protein product [Chilo suppressalis]